ncbi:glycosyltransferase [Algibacter amylolyticus]|uniref:Glycosyltransferase n=2 Tax=Algibacter amylolyticus TaxID=1608400 RepID=A0A5M7AYK4_9FLAO|nr:glycosyltransferase [Algibacter amylolyticus]MBB5269166.1 putative glycosyltransferase involved in capsule biosynthesis [Algibacter amylolyticus]TSJ73593.1 glycosyltransferase [Algibacter amylolyticus]
MQTSNDFRVLLVDYGSHNNFSEALKTCVKKYSFIQRVYCPVEGQLWNKSRAINIALQQCDTPYFLVGDIDLIFHPDFIKIANKLASEDVHYFKYSFLSQEESLKDKKFIDYKIDFEGNKEVTGTTLFSTAKLKSVNGYDEFYHGWGAEDTDIHIRLKNLGLKVHYYTESILLKHQWHPKAYRNKNSSSPFHSNLERVNHNYMYLTLNNKIVNANTNESWGCFPKEEDYEKLLNKPDFIIEIKPTDNDFSALLAHLKNCKGKIVEIKINQVDIKDKQRQNLKKLLKKKFYNYLDLEIINNLLLEEIIKNYRSKPYKYRFDRVSGSINLVIYLN